MEHLISKFSCWLVVVSILSMVASGCGAPVQTADSANPASPSAAQPEVEAETESSTSPTDSEVDSPAAKEESQEPPQNHSNSVPAVTNVAGTDPATSQTKLVNVFPPAAEVIYFLPESLPKPDDTVKDYSGREKHGKVGTREGKLGVRVPSLIGTQKEYTLVTWVKPGDELSLLTELNVHGIVYKSSCNSKNQFVSEAHHHSEQIPNTWVTGRTEEGSLKSNEWNFVAIRVANAKESTADATAFVNGKQQAIDVQESSPSYEGWLLHPTSDRLRLFAVYHRPLTDEQIATLYAAGPEVQPKDVNQAREITWDNSTGQPKDPGGSTPPTKLELAELIEQVKPAVVAIETDLGTGTGFVVNGGYVVTNVHVVEGSDTVTIKFNDGTAVNAIGVLYVDEARDIAIVKIPPAPEGKSRSTMKLSGQLPKQGEDVIALGNPRGFEFSVTRGIVSSVRSAESINGLVNSEKFQGTWIQTDTAISPGNSGGPLINPNGQIVAMNTFTRRDSQNLNFAISATDIQDALGKVQPDKVASFPIETLATGDVEVASAAGEYGFLNRAMTAAAIERFPTLTNVEFNQVQNGNLHELFDPISAAEIKAGTVARIRGVATIVQILEDGALVKFGSTKCFLVFLSKDGAELRAKVGDNSITGVPFDSLFYVSEAKEYATEDGKKSFFIPIISLGEFPMDAWKPDFDAMLAIEARRRSTAGAVAKDEAYQRAVEKLTHKFVDAAGRNEVEGIAVELQEDAVVMFRVTDNVKLTVKLDQLSQKDQEWLQDNKNTIKFYGQKVLDKLE